MNCIVLYQRLTSPVVLGYIGNPASNKTHRFSILQRHLTSVFSCHYYHMNCGWHYSYRQEFYHILCVQGREKELFSRSGTIHFRLGTCMWLNAVTFHVFKITFDSCLIFALLSHWDTPSSNPRDNMDFTVKPRHPFTVGALTGLLRPITTNTKYPFSSQRHP